MKIAVQITFRGNYKSYKIFKSDFSNYILKKAKKKMPQLFQIKLWRVQFLFQ